MSDKDICTDNDWSISPFSQDDSSFDSLLSTTSNPRCNPYKTPATPVCPQPTNQQLYTETNQAMQHTITCWLKTNNTTQSRQQQPALNPTTLPTTKLWTKQQPQRTLQPPLHQLLANNHWEMFPLKTRSISKWFKKCQLSVHCQPQPFMARGCSCNDRAQCTCTLHSGTQS